MRDKLIIIGASGHGKVLLDTALKNNYEVLGFLDDSDSLKEVSGYPVLGNTASANNYENDIKFVIGIGSNTIRKKIASKYNLNWATLIHPNAVVGKGVSLKEGTVVMANAVINPDAKIGKHCIINTCSVLEHDNNIGDFTHISPGAILAGTVSVGENVHIGAGAVVKNNIMITDNITVGAGAVVVKDIEEQGVYVGVPARRIKK